MYVSGARVRNAKRPDASVVTEAVCDGLETVTTAPAIGAEDVASTTEPVRPPVVPASAHVSWLTKCDEQYQSGNDLPEGSPDH